MSKLKNYISIIIMLALIAVVGVLLLTGVLDVDETIAAVRDNKPAALLAILALFAVKGCSMVIPFAAVCIGTSLVFDLKMAMAINIVGTALCVSVLSRLIGYEPLPISEIRFSVFSVIPAGKTS